MSIVKIREVYETTSRETGKSLELITSIGQAVFQSLRDTLNFPVELAYVVPKLGTFILRQKNYIKKFRRYYNMEELPQAGDKARRKKQSVGIIMDKVLEFKDKKAEVKKLKDEYRKKRREASQGNI